MRLNKDISINKIHIKLHLSILCYKKDVSIDEVKFKIL